MRTVPIVDLFSGPGGLGEGFSAFRAPDGRHGYRVALSIEMDAAAYRTLRLRAFLRKFGAEFPAQYYDFLNGTTDGEPDWGTLYPEHWNAACDETRCMELGKPPARSFLQRRIKHIRAEQDGRTILLGGPPCQSYSVVGRSRNAGNVSYDPDRDTRQLLYEEYVHVLRQLRPAVAVMENVKGMLSAWHTGQPIFPKVLRELQCGSGSDGYRLFALASRSGVCSWDEDADPRDFLVHAEDHGVPQARHRVFVVCIRNDVARSLPEELLPRLEPRRGVVPLGDVIGSMPRLRSRLSRHDSPESWQAAVQRACEFVKANPPAVMKQDEKRLFHSALEHTLAMAHGDASPFRDAFGGIALPPGCPDDLREWLEDENLGTLPNNEARSHKPEDLARYLYAAVFGYALRRSPKTVDFPEELASPHANWNTGKFSDRFRVQLPDHPSTTVTSHISKDGHYFIHPDPSQVRSLTVREAARLQTFPDNYFFHGNRTQQYVQVGNAVPPFLAWQIAQLLWAVLDHHDRSRTRLESPGVDAPDSGPAREDTHIPLAAMGTT